MSNTPDQPDEPSADRELKDIPRVGAKEHPIAGLIPAERTLRELSPTEMAHRQELDRRQKEHDLNEVTAANKHRRDLEVTERQERRLNTWIAVGATFLLLVIGVLFSYLGLDSETRKDAMTIILTAFTALMSFLAGKGVSKGS